MHGRSHVVVSQVGTTIPRHVCESTNVDEKKIISRAGNDMQKKYYKAIHVWGIHPQSLKSKSVSIDNNDK